MVAKVRIIEENLLETLSGDQAAVVECGQTVDPRLPVLLLSNIGLVEDLSQDVEDHEDKPAAEQRPAAFTAEELSRPRNVGVPSCCGGDVGDGEEHWETVSPGHQATNFTESVHDQREALGVDVGGDGVLPEGESVLLVDGHAVVSRFCPSSLAISKVQKPSHRTK